MRRLLVCALLPGLALAGCGGGSGSAGFGVSTGDKAGSRAAKAFGVKAAKEASSDASLSSALAADAALEQGIQLVFDKADERAKGPKGPTAATSWIRAVVQSVSPDLSHITIKPLAAPRRSPKIGEPVAVFHAWQVVSDIALPGDMREHALARGEVEQVTNDALFLVRINDFFSGAKIAKGSAVIIGWY